MRIDQTSWLLVSSSIYESEQEKLKVSECDRFMELRKSKIYADCMSHLDYFHRGCYGIARLSSQP